MKPSFFRGRKRQQQPWKRTSTHHHRSFSSSHHPLGKKKESRIRSLLRVALSRGFLMNVFLGLGVAALFGVVILTTVIIIFSRQLPDPGVIDTLPIAQSTKIYDRTGDHLLYEIHGEQKRTVVSLEQIPRHVQNALIAAEDERFYSHHGIDIRGIIRAAVFNPFSDVRQGGSTITQQMVKNVILSPERTYTRKIKEIILSLIIETRYSKDEILWRYLNTIPFGSTNYGVEAASQSYFGKSVSELSVAEGATLIGMINAPTRYINNPDQLLRRRNTVIGSMRKNELLTQSEAEEALASSTPLDIQPLDIVAPHFVFYVKELLEEEYGQRFVEEGGLTVTTSINYELQIAAEEEVGRAVEERGESHGFSNAALVAIDPDSGQILSMVGSHDYFDEESDGAVNVALRPRQPGSSMKPMAFTALFEKGYTPNTVFYDVETDFPGTTGNYHPRNYDLAEHGPVTVRKALQGSLNIPAVKALYMVGVPNFLDFVERMGYTTLGDRSRFGLSVVLGGGEVALLEHTNAYAAFASGGIQYEPVSILRVEKSERGETPEVIEEWKEVEGRRVIDSNIAAMITNVLADNGARAYAFGLNSALQLGGRPVAAKTGTTNDYRDGWTMGYTPSIVVGVWGGNNDNSVMHRGSGGSSVAAPIWNAVMRAYLDGTPVESFPGVEIPTRGNVAIDGGLGQGQPYLVDRITGLLATDETPVRLREERLFVSHHSILHHVNRNDPLGGTPGDPSSDPMYGPWEAAVLDWVARQVEETGVPIDMQEPPTEYDDVHTERNTPVVEFEMPGRNDTLESRSVFMEVRVRAPRQIARVEFFVDNFYLGASDSAPYQLQTVLPSFVSGGQHTLRAVVFDDVENEGEATVSVRVPAAETTGVRILDPQPNQEIRTDLASYLVGVQFDDLTRYSKLNFYVSPRVGSGQTLVGSLTPSRAIESFEWSLPGPGEYIFSAVAIEQDTNELIPAGNVLVTVRETVSVVEE